MLNSQKYKKLKRENIEKQYLTLQNFSLPSIQGNKYVHEVVILYLH